MIDYPCPLPRVLTDSQPAARALLRGSGAYPDLRGEALFYPFQDGSLLLVRALGLPDGFHGFHLHEQGECCTGGDIPFYCAGDHFSMETQSHPNHTGDFPVLLSNDGRVFSVFYTNRFRPEQAVGRAVIVHEKPDDYRSQPAGDSGTRIACGVVEAL